MLALMTCLPPSLLQVGADAADSFRTLGKRSILALLGIVIGSASIIAVINIGHNARQEVASVFHNMGVDTFAVSFSVKQGRQASPLSIEAATFRKLVLEGLLIAPAAIVPAQAGFNHRTINIRLVGTEPSLLDVMKLSLAYGRFLHPFDQDENVVVLGHDIATSLSSDGTLIKTGDWLKINNYLFRVIGVLQSRTHSLISPVSADLSVFVPLQAMNRVASEARIDDLVARIPLHKKSENVASTFGEMLTRTFKSRDIEVVTPVQMIEGMNSQNRTFHYLLMALGVITLVGGGVAVMNVMYMNVSERRSEIGLRMAMGARRQDIRNLFLIEAAALSVLGAVLGAGLGMALAYIYAQVSGWAFAMAFSAIPLGVTSTVLVGVFFGLKPAITASRLTPVEALRDY